MVAQALFALPWWSVQGFCVFIVSCLLRYSWWKAGILALCLPSLWWVMLWLLAQGLSPWWYFCIFILLFAVSKNAIVERVPLFLSTSEVLSHLVEILPENCRFIDLGCGTGRVLFALAKARPDVQLCGVENAWLPFAFARICQFFYSNVHIRYGSIWQQDLRDFDVVYCYLSPAPMSKLWEKFLKEARPNAWLVSNTFVVPNCPPDFVFDAGDAIQSCLYIWHYPPRV